MRGRHLAARVDRVEKRLPPPSQRSQVFLEHIAAGRISRAKTSICYGLARFFECPHALNPASAYVVCFAAMVCLAIAVNLMPIFLTTLRVERGGRGGLSGEQLGRIGGVTFAGLVGGILFTGPLADRRGGKLFSVLGTLLIGIGLGLLTMSPSYSV